MLVQVDNAMFDSPDCGFRGRGVGRTRWNLKNGKANRQNWSEVDSHHRWGEM